MPNGGGVHLRPAIPMHRIRVHIAGGQAECSAWNAPYHSSCRHACA
ncbi:hypothetical protein WDD9_001980 [Paenibacillus melissococcoides]|nr:MULTISPECIES: hypothetical protein [Paenibacillus]MEB9892045.1 hypothetical protein [Bacillus cereus]CAH8708640.1 hypothetical protein WDD9_001980 [Paenibacillus melissococcoides]CAH8709365.1 hypothetical protein HTL2_002266 [Paenibacillus melissococcoides]